MSWEERGLAGKCCKGDRVQEVLAPPLMYCQDPLAAGRYLWSMENMTFPRFGGYLRY